MQSKAWVLVGLGNPGKEYEETRHNLGFMVVENFAKTIKASFKSESKFESRVAHKVVDGEVVHMLLPQTYMNESGRAVQKFLNFYKLDSASLIVVVDDMALAFGKLRVKMLGSPGGHNGLKSIRNAVGTDQYIRLRVGIGSSGMLPHEVYVLDNFSGEEKKMLQIHIDEASASLLRLIREDFNKVSSDINRSKERE